MDFYKVRIDKNGFRTSQYRTITRDIDLPYVSYNLSKTITTCIVLLSRILTLFSKFQLKSNEHCTPDKSFSFFTTHFVYLPRETISLSVRQICQLSLEYI